MKSVLHPYLQPSFQVITDEKRRRNAILCRLLLGSVSMAAVGTIILLFQYVSLGSRYAGAHPIVPFGVFVLF